MRALGVDVGEVRVGLAVSDPSGTVATPLGTVEGGEPADVAVRVAEAARAQGCEIAVVGLPRSLSGRATASTRRARAVADALRGQGLRIELWDERLSSAEAERVLLAADRSRSQRRAERDRVAAALILQGWLQARGVRG